jgi:hypothetical protein
MKVTLDLTRLREQGLITDAEYDKLLQLGKRDTGSLGINILVGFGVVAVVAGLGALMPTPEAAMVLGAIAFALGLVILYAGGEQWSLLSQICLVIGALMVCGAIIYFDDASLRSLLIVTALLAVAAIVARSSLLMVAAVLMLAGSLGARTGYWHATYSLAIQEPLLTIVVFSLLALGAYLISKYVSSDYERVALNAARTSIFLINFGFWIGSLWGDRMTMLGGPQNFPPIPRWPFTLGWALALIAVALWGMQANRRWVVNVAAVFGAIHFYTQWFGYLGGNPASVLLGGVLMLVFAYGFWMFNRRITAQARPPAQSA